jgi:hypothetical protein
MLCKRCGNSDRMINTSAYCSICQTVIYPNPQRELDIERTIEGMREIDSIRIYMSNEEREKWIREGYKLLGERIK